LVPAPALPAPPAFAPDRALFLAVGLGRPEAAGRSSGAPAFAAAAFAAAGLAPAARAGFPVAASPSGAETLPRAPLGASPPVAAARSTAPGSSPSGAEALPRSAVAASPSVAAARSTAPGSSSSGAAVVCGYFRDAVTGADGSN
jgi:hypothetical protein